MPMVLALALGLCSAPANGAAVSGGSAPAFLMEDGASYLLLESGDRLLLE